MNAPTDRDRLRREWAAARARHAFLALADGAVFRGVAFGARTDALGEAVFNTGMTGYQEILTDPSYAGQFVVLTTPEVGNYGCNPEDAESRGLFLAGLVARNDLPQMSIDCDFGLPWIGVVSFDFQQVAHTVASFLRENGHRRIGIVYPLRTEPERVPEFHYIMNDRATVLEPFLREPMRFDRIFEIVSERHQFGEPFREQIREAMEDPEPPTAFWCRDDISAMELIRVLRSFRCDVPEDFSVIGFDDLSAAESFDPPLTTLRNPVYELGYQAMYLLDHYIMQGVDSIAHITRLAPVLCVRKSVGARKISPAGGPWQHNI